MNSRFILAAGLLTCMTVLWAGCAPAEPVRPGRPPSDTSSTKSDEQNETSSPQGTTTESVTEVQVEPASHSQLMERVAAAKGKVVVVDVWSTSCVPCMREYPNLVALSKRFPEDVQCISFNVDYLGLPKKPVDSYIPAVKKFLSEQKSELMNLISSEADSDVLAKLEVESMPAILIYDRQGGLVAKLTDDSAGEDGLTYKSDVLPLVERLAAVKPAAN